MFSPWCPPPKTVVLRDDEVHVWRASLDLTASDFPDEAVSADGRNFPRFAPTTAVHKPEVNCFQSWMTRLNDRLAKAWEQPVFIANEGWGGHDSAQYLAVMRGNRGGWRDRWSRGPATAGRRTLAGAFLADPR